MPKELYNEGRVVGYSAYEMYVRHHLSVDPEHTPASEKEWLASMMAMGSSMLLKINSEVGKPFGIQGSHYIEIDFPTDSRLCAANNIIASFFSGEDSTLDNSEVPAEWATKITDYGPLIQNNSANFPENPDKVPPMASDISGLSNDTIKQIHEYMKIIDGIVIQPGTWTDNPNKPPQKDFTPILSQAPKLRILVSDKIETDFYIMLTGFTNRTVVDGQTGFDTAVNTQSHSDGDFLGPWAFPWAAKIFFSIPSSFVNYFMNNKYEREMKSGTASIAVKSDTIVDFKQNYSGESNNYYSQHDTDSTLPVDVTDINIVGEDAAVIASYMHSGEDGTVLPPSLYGALINSNGEKQFIPLDTVAPGSLHMYHGSINDTSVNSPYQRADTLESQNKGAKAFLRDKLTYVINQLDSTDMKYDVLTDRIIPVSDDVTENTQQFSISNTPYMWLFNHNNNSVDDEFDNVTALLINKFIHGVLSQSFISQYAFSYAEVKALQDYKFPASGTVEGIFTLAKEITVLFDMVKSIAERERANYNYILRGGYSRQGSPTQQYFFMPVHKNTNMVSIMAPTGIDLTSADKNVYLHMKSDGKLDYLGSWFGGTELTGDDIGYGDYGELLHHPLQKYAILQDSIFYQPNAVTPYPSGEAKAKYKYDFLQWFKDTNVTDMIPIDKFTTYGIDSSYEKLSVYEFLQCCCSRDLSIPYTSADSFVSATNKRFKYTMYLYSRKVIEKLKISDVSKNPITFDKGHELRADVRAQSITNPTNFFYDAPTQFNVVNFHEEQITDPKTNQTSIVDVEDIGADITANCTSTQNAVWAAVSKSGHHANKAISLIDKSGIPLPRLGSAGTIDANNLIWEDLMIALNQNKSIDLLGNVLKGLKLNLTDSGPNYIEFANGLRLYISNTPPTDSDIPSGSIGIGW